MASKYDQFKYNYTNDLGQNRVKLQRAYYEETGNNKTYTTPITSLFLARQVSSSSKLNGTSKLTRRLLVYLNFEGEQIERTCQLPYPPLDSNLVAHIKEIFAVENVICGDYLGENPLEKDETSN